MPAKGFIRISTMVIQPPFNVPRGPEQTLQRDGREGHGGSGSPKVAVDADGGPESGDEGQ